MYLKFNSFLILFVISLFSNLLTPHFPKQPLKIKHRWQWDMKTRNSKMQNRGQSWCYSGCLFLPFVTAEYCSCAVSTELDGKLFALQCHVAQYRIKKGAEMKCPPTWHVSITADRAGADKYQQPQLIPGMKADRTLYHDQMLLNVGGSFWFSVKRNMSVSKWPPGLQIDQMLSTNTNMLQNKSHHVQVLHVSSAS